ncbi:MAG: DUF3606 domain-containing protein [Agriterribacter sp.]
MPDDKTKTGSADDKRIDKNDKSELAYWSAKFGVTNMELINAIEKAGSPMVEKVRKILKK